MKFKRAGEVAAVCGLMLASVPASTLSKDKRPSIAWKPSFQAALQEAKRTKKPLLVDFWAKWCGPCRAMDERTYTNAAVVKQSRMWVAVQVDIEAEPEIASRYGLSTDGGSTFQSSLVQPWKIESCPMSSYALLDSGGAVRAAWETQEQIYSASIEPATVKSSPPVAAPGTGDNRKHPTVAFNSQGEMLLAWTEGTGWNKGGSLAWQLYGKDGKPTAQKGRQDGVPTWGLPSAVAIGHGSFLLLY